MHVHNAINQLMHGDLYTQTQKIQNISGVGKFIEMIKMQHR